eukprot:m.278821 g.278821  ORF g.278821 m.278821 type:complete len:90 (+) comp54893_c2_seq4:2611-2880(+)
MPWRELARELAPAEITEDEFWSAIHTWDTRANLVNRRLAGCEVTETLTGLSTSALEQALHERGLQIELGALRLTYSVLLLIPSPNRFAA